MTRPRAYSALTPRRDPASTAAAPSGPGTRRRPAPSVSRARAVPHRLGRLFAASGPLGTTAAGLLSGWRPLIVFWACLLAVLAAGGAVLQRLGPPPQTRAEPHARGHGTRAPPDAPTVAALAAPPAAAPALATPAPVPGGVAESPQGRPAPDARAGDTARQANGPEAADRTGAPTDAPPGGPLLVVFHPLGSEAGKAAAQQLAARAGVDDDRLTMEPVANAPARAIIRFYAASDHALARRLGRELAQLGYAWQIENLSARPQPGRRAVEVVLPVR